MNRVSCLIPLYKSRRHLDLVLATVDDHVERGATVILSDQHSLDDVAKVVQERYAANPLVRVLTSDGGGNWVENVNLLIANVETMAFRIIPHDDSVPVDSTQSLLDTLVRHPDAVLSHGHVRAEDVDGNRLPDRDEPNMPLIPKGLSRAAGTAFSLGLFWDGYFNGAFKALMRTKPIRSHSLFIRKTPTLVHSERAWLFALSLLGEFVFEPSAYMTKRYWSGSLTDGWSWGGAEIIDVAHCMASYVDDLVEPEALQRSMHFNIFLNATNWFRWLDGTAAARPPFNPLMPHTGSWNPPRWSSPVSTELPDGS